MVEQEGIEVMVALDVSRSMLAQDIKPDRLSRAKREIADLMTRLGGDEIGLVLFSGASFIQFPLTSDYGTALTFLDNARPEVISQPGTAIGNAIRTAMTGFDMSRASQKVIVLITDGKDHQGDALTAAEAAAEQGVLLYTIGFGSPEGEPISEYNDRGEVVGYKVDQNGEVVLSRLDEACPGRKCTSVGGLAAQNG
jgi:Ca-activated chloride channel family protein